MVIHPDALQAVPIWLPHYSDTANIISVDNFHVEKRDFTDLASLDVYDFTHSGVKEQVSAELATRFVKPMCFQRTWLKAAIVTLIPGLSSFFKRPMARSISRTYRPLNNTHLAYLYDVAKARATGECG